MALETLTNVLNYLKIKKIDIQKASIMIEILFVRLLTIDIAHRGLYYRASEGDVGRDYHKLFRQGEGEAKG